MGKASIFFPSGHIPSPDCPHPCVIREVVVSLACRTLRQVVAIVSSWLACLEPAAASPVHPVYSQTSDSTSFRMRAEGLEPMSADPGVRTSNVFIHPAFIQFEKHRFYFQNASSYQHLGSSSTIRRHLPGEN